MDLCLLAERLEHGHFVWPGVETGSVHLTPERMSMLL
jgi:transposase